MLSVILLVGVGPRFHAISRGGSRMIYRYWENFLEFMLLVEVEPERYTISREKSRNLYYW